MNKKTLLSLGILSLVLVLGVGYAIVTSVEIGFKGNVRVHDADIKVYIDSYTDETERANIEHNIINNNKTDEFTITDMKIGEEAKLTYTIASKEQDVYAYIEETAEIENSNPEFFDVTYSIVGSPVLGTVGSGKETSKVELKVKIKGTPITKEESTATIRFTIKAIPNKEE